MEEKKTFVLDTNVLLQSPTALFAFNDNDVILTEVVLEEIDNFKNGRSELNANARHVARILDDLRMKGKLTDGVKINDNGTLKVETNHYDVKLPKSWDIKNNDYRILQVCKALQDEGKIVRLVTKDIIERIKADIIGIVAEDFEYEQAPILDSQYTGRKEIYINDDKLNNFFKNNNLPLENLNAYVWDKDNINYNCNFIPNEFILMRSTADPDRKTGLGRVSSDLKKIESLYFVNEHPYGVTARNAGQRFMQEALMTGVNEAPLVIIKGKAGSAKTFYSLAVGLENVVNKNNFRKILVCRPNVTMDENIGFLPGTEKEKISPYMRSIYDNLEILVDSNAEERYKDESELADRVQELFARRYIDTESIGFLRGRSICKQYVIIDEAQNLTPKQVIGIVTRVSQDTKIVLCGDPQQIDSPFLDSRTNGLSYISELMKGSELCYQVTLTDEECVRSKLVNNVLKQLSDKNF